MKMKYNTNWLIIYTQLPPHPNVARILDTVWNISSGGVELYLVTERCAGGDLAKYIEDHGAFTEIEVSFTEAHVIILVKSEN